MKHKHACALLNWFICLCVCVCVCVCVSVSGCSRCSYIVFSQNRAPSEYFITPLPRVTWQLPFYLFSTCLARGCLSFSSSCAPITVFYLRGLSHSPCLLLRASFEILFGFFCVDPLMMSLKYGTVNMRDYYGIDWGGHSNDYQYTHTHLHQHTHIPPHRHTHPHTGVWASLEQTGLVALCCRPT